MNLLALDVGVTTGVAYDIPPAFNHTTTYDNCEGVWALVTAKGHWDVVVYENFTTQFINQYGLYTVRLIGGILALCLEHKIPCVSQTPQFRRAYINQAQGILQARGGKHAKHEIDALAHLLAFKDKH